MRMRENNMKKRFEVIRALSHKTIASFDNKLDALEKAIDLEDSSNIRYWVYDSEIKEVVN
jgi:hypothetical protein